MSQPLEIECSYQHWVPLSRILTKSINRFLILQNDINIFLRFTININKTSIWFKKLSFNCPNHVRNSLRYTSILLSMFELLKKLQQFPNIFLARRLDFYLLISWIKEIIPLFNSLKLLWFCKLKIGWEPMNSITYFNTMPWFLTITMNQTNFLRIRKYFISLIFIRISTHDFLLQ